MIPAHVAPIGTQLAPDYFSPGAVIIRGETVGSPWAIAYWLGNQYRYERAGLGKPWVRVS